MRICVLGGHGKSGGRVVARAQSAGHETQVLESDVLERDGLVRAIRGADAVISLIGPRPGSARDLCSKAALAIIEVMRAEGVQRLVMVTGAMSGPPEGLGVFYRAMTHLPPLARALADRRQQEALVAASPLDWTLVRPPRLNDDEPVTTPRVRTNGPVRMLASCSRAHLAAVLVGLATTQQYVREGVYVDTP